MATEKKITWVDSVVDAKGHAIPGTEGGVPSHWLDKESGFLPEGAKKGDPKPDADAVDVDAAVAEAVAEANAAKDAEIAALRKQLEDAQKAPAGK